MWRRRWLPRRRWHAGSTRLAAAQVAVIRVRVHRLVVGVGVRRLGGSMAERLAPPLRAVAVAVRRTCRADGHGAARVRRVFLGWLLSRCKAAAHIGAPLAGLTGAAYTVRLRLRGIAPSLACLELQVAH